LFSTLSKKCTHQKNQKKLITKGCQTQIASYRILLSPLEFAKIWNPENERGAALGRQKGAKSLYFLRGVAAVELSTALIDGKISYLMRN
jgi:hypothetical protein